MMLAKIENYMNGYGYPKYKKSQKTGKIGESYINNFVHQKLEWIYRSVPQESDFGIDGYMDIIKNESVTGQTIGIQIKCGDSYYYKRTEGGIRYDGDNKHLNFYINSPFPIILLVLNSDCTEGRWVEFKYNIISQSKKGWWIEIPDKNALNQETKEKWELIVGDIPDNSEIINSSWQINKLIDESEFGIYKVPKYDVLKCNFKGLIDVIERLSRNRKSVLKNRGTLEVLIDGYDEDPREVYEIPEIRHWYNESIKAGIPWFYFIGSRLGKMGLKVLLFCYCEIKIESEKSGITKVKITSLEMIPDWLDQNFGNLNRFTDEKDIPEEINKEMSDRATSFVKTSVFQIKS